MSALQPGAKAPDFDLADADGRRHALSGILPERPALVVFFKTTCPTCRLAFPYLEKLNQAYGDCVPFLGVSQDPLAEAASFARENGGASFPLLADLPPDCAASGLYGLTNVPSLFAVDRGGRVAATCVGFSKRDYRDLAGLLADWSDRLVVDLFPPGDRAPESKPG